MMFDLKRPCVSCPFRVSVAGTFGLRRGRLREILTGPGFQCHKTVDYDAEGPDRQGKNPQQCAGLMALLHRVGEPNQIMQVGERLGHFDPEQLVLDDTFDSLQAALEAHGRSE